MKTFGAVVLLAAYYATEVEAGDNACYFHKNKNQCENEAPKGKYELKNSSDSDCECKCKWNENNCDEYQEFFTSDSKSGKAKKQNCGCGEKMCE